MIVQFNELASEFSHHIIFYNGWYGSHIFEMNLLRDIAREQAMNFWPPGVDQIEKSRMVAPDEATKQITL